jgi:type III secretion protein T
MDFESVGQAVVAFALVLPRIAAAFLLLPFFSSETIPPLVRNVFFVSVALAVMPLVLREVPPAMVGGTALLPVILKEIFIGLTIGFAFGIVFWALEGAGQVIDTKIGAASAQVSDPVSGQQTTLIGSFLARVGGYLFAAFGGLQLFIDLVLSSFRVWPALDPLPDLNALGSLFIIARFDELMRLTLLLAAPALCILTLLEVGAGFINRYAPQLNVFTLSMAIKGWLAALILIFTVINVSGFVLDWIGDQRGLLRLLFPAGAE